MKGKLKKWHIGVFSVLILFVAVFASLMSLKATTVDEEETPEELVDNWEISTVFYDSSVDKGMIDSDGNYDDTQLKTPLKSINWDASNLSYDEEETRIITVQINYKNTNAVTTYQAGDLTLTIPNLMYEGGYKKVYNSETGKYEYEYYGAYLSNLKASIIVGANDSTHSKYDWDFTTGTSPTVKQKTFTFTNAKVFEEKANFEGSIQIVYTITSKGESSYQPVIEKYEDECTHTYSIILQSTLSYNKTVDSTVEKISISSNESPFNYTRTYTHPWKIRTVRFKKAAYKITAYDNLGSNASDYIWVRYNFGLDDSFASYPYIGLNDSTALIYDVFPKECVVYTAEGTLLSPADDNGTYIIGNISGAELTSTGYYDSYRDIYVGYPKSVYNEEAGNLEITNKADYYGYWDNAPDELQYLTSSSVTLNLANFEFTYTGNLYSIAKGSQPVGYQSGWYYLRYQSIINNLSDNKMHWRLSPTVKYTGKPLTIKIGDDLLYATDKNGTPVKLTDDEYYFSNISFPSLRNAHGTEIADEKYNCELWIRYAEDSSYTLYEEFLNKAKSWSFTKEDKVVSFYFIIFDLNESLVPESAYKNNISATTKFIKKDIPESGTLYNFDYIQTYFRDNDGNLILQNEPELSSYSNLMTQLEIATLDQQTYGTYMQRATASENWEYYYVDELNNSIRSYKTAHAISQNAEEELFTGSFTIGAGVVTDNTLKKDYFTEYTANSFVRGVIFYDLLPEGMELDSSTEEIIETLDILCGDNSTISTGLKNKNVYASYAGSSHISYVYDKNGSFISPQKLYEIAKENTIIEITENWKGTNRTRIKVTIDLSNNPLMFTNTYTYDRYIVGFSVKYNYQISYDSILTYGKIYTNNVYSEILYPTPNQTKYQPGGSTSANHFGNSEVTDNGEKDFAAADINENNNTEEKLAMISKNITITSIISTHQDVTTYVKTDQSNYSTGIVDTSNNSEYEYKLRVRTGAADVTNLVIYTSIEEAQPNRTRWYGEFMGVDTTYAENKGYTVKVWYSPNKTVGTLAEDTSWLEYDEATVDKSKVKSLAFQYLVETDDTTGTSADAITPATLPANSLTYVLIKMKSPANENETRLARMDCWTEWNAIDELEGIVDGIVGINSNVVKVALPNSVKADDMPSISLKFTKEITGSDSAFEKMGLNKANEQLFVIRLTNLTANDDGSYNQVTGMLSSNTGLIISQIPIGTYLLEELGDNYFDFVDFTNNNDPEIVVDGVTFEKTDQGYIITVSEDLAQNVEFNIKVTNKIEDERFYEGKHNKENLFLINKNGLDHDVPQD